MKRIASAIVLALLALPSPAMAMPNAFWIFGFDVPGRHASGAPGAAIADGRIEVSNQALLCAVVDIRERPDTMVPDVAGDARAQARFAAGDPVGQTLAGTSVGAMPHAQL